VRLAAVACLLGAAVAGAGCGAPSAREDERAKAYEFTAKVSACLDARRLPYPWVLTESVGSLHARFGARADALGIAHRDGDNTQQQSVLVSVNTTRLGVSYPYLIASPDRLRVITGPGGNLRQVEHHGAVSAAAVRPYAMYASDPPGVEQSGPTYIDFERNRFCRGAGSLPRSLPNPFVSCQFLAARPGHVVSFEFSAEAEDQLPRISEAVAAAAKAIVVPCPASDRDAR
jgi:hypothetical protein